jgi:predicted nuclease of predicted toxin-antitoxin system
VKFFKFFIDECLSPQLARRLNRQGIDAFHPLDVGRRGEPDHAVLARCIAEDRVLVTENAADFRRLVGAGDLHPALVILPAIDREGTWRLLQAVLEHLRCRSRPEDYMVNRVIEIDEAGVIRVFLLPSSGQ